ncbi:hypothetical protein DUNSADRAFT_6025 [Dunaliella salina]|uniref:Uncharacterized protein n=1 Tax=Dunaliella salina TaxID=3046 RepID=A0ABQ7FU01_DUNSA|nr:hypothetical protein DUNSADRAFT_6025 [Dunaliella salina]|eukprot:KAF5825906.1 hypothetical protein DUNSADRAFT_6025 [Dunaliella salina]
MGKEAAEDPFCSCNIFGAQGRALKQNKKLANNLVSSGPPPGVAYDVPQIAELNTSSLEHESTRVNLGRRALLSQSLAQGNFYFSHKFTTAGATGREGPSLAALQDAYADKAWAQDPSVLKSDSGIQIWTVQQSGTYRIEAQVS